MGRVREKLNINFVVSARDNFYDTGLTGVDDDVFEQSFMNIYTAKNL
jgi:tartrate-resistant acid phosphatase type 5